jgi:Protein of unknown function (DUF3775)
MDRHNPVTPTDRKGDERMQFSEIVQDTIARAAACRTEEAEISKKLGLKGGVTLFSEEADKLAKAPRPAKAELKKYLMSLPDEIVFKLQTLMYFGRGDDPDLHGFHKSLKEQTPTKGDAIRAMMEKAPLGEYLANGLRLASAHGIDVEGTF